MRAGQCRPGASEKIGRMRRVKAHQSGRLYSLQSGWYHGSYTAFAPVLDGIVAVWRGKGRFSFPFFAAVVKPIANMKTDITNMKTDITNMKTDITNMKADITNMKSDIVQLKGSVKTIELKLENEIGRKISALFDARMDELRYRKENKETREKVFELDMRVDNLEKAIMPA